MRKINLFLIIAAVAVIPSCTKNFLDRNTNKENATEEMMTWDGLTTGSAFAQMTRNVIPSYQLIGDEEYGSANFQVVQDLSGNIFSGYVGVINSGFNANNVYNITARNWYEAMFSDAYTRAMGSWEELDAVREEFPNEAALADILKVAVMHRVTDTYGPIPYSQIGSGSVTMAYDSQESIYRKFFEELDNAITVLTAFYQAQPSVKVLEAYDNVYGGNVASWIKFANTLRLRLAMRVVYADEALAMQQADVALANPLGTLAVPADIAALHKPSTGAWEYALYVIQYSFNDARIGATIETYMNSYLDPRREKYFTKGSDGNFHGVRTGVSINAAYQNSNLLSRVNCTNNDDLVWMVPAEAWFLKAEYHLRKSDEAMARQCYEEGVRVAFATSGASGADAYLANAELTVGEYTDAVNPSNSYRTALSENTVAWEDGQSFEKNFEKIITQKYIAIFPEGQEAWTEFRRTGYPKVIPVSNNSSSGAIDTNLQIRRLNYPSTEYRTNQDNVSAAVEVLKSESSKGRSDNGGTRLWWDKNTRF